MEDLNRRIEELEKAKKAKDQKVKEDEEAQEIKEKNRKKQNQGFLAGIKSFQVDDIWEEHILSHGV